MVYYGVVSKGCQRCRQRKIKCDQRKPGCTRCHKSGLPCPGYRDLNEVIFRDESSRIIRISHKQGKKQTVSVLPGGNPPLAPSLSPSATNSLPASLSSPAGEVGANFFFAKYVFHQDPFSMSSGYEDWLATAYRHNDRRCAPLRAAIEAAGLAGLSNINPSPQLSIQSKQQYRDALTAVKEALSNPSQAADDATLMAVILLGLYEMINFDTWDRYHNWTTHIQGATALLDLRGQEQFTRERGGQLYVQIRPQIVWPAPGMHEAAQHCSTCSCDSNIQLSVEWYQGAVASAGDPQSSFDMRDFLSRGQPSSSGEAWDVESGDYP
ncbi:hypothetical protein B0T21DRAFT_384718 [Apiosordaria backusii]|uniref:Zn(2)-C6 fungal-type domain-containing protein n=1 Tax=Apiosordaria backusii TaxID=314023 RepID=A0AA40BDX3_9PEZI|nr:hypothetical protein B0T21DRAFT_384718 [Apiosordaria backusii]